MTDRIPPKRQFFDGDESIGIEANQKFQTNKNMVLFAGQKAKLVSDKLDVSLFWSAKNH